MKNNFRVILIGFLPPPHTGQSTAFMMAIKFFEERNLPFVVVDIADRVTHRVTGRFSWARIREVMQSTGVYLKYVWKRNQIVYLSIAFSRIGFWRDFLFIWLAYLFRHRIVLHAHGGGYNQIFESQPYLLQKFIRITLTRADRLIVLGKLLQTQFDFLPDVESKISIVENCPPDGIKIVSNPRVRVDGQPLRILYLSNLLETKGYIDVLAAIKILHQKKLPIYADFCGKFMLASDSAKYSNPLDAEVAFVQMVSTLNLSQYVKYHGVVQELQKETILKQADIFILPTYYINEGQPISILEAMANALPVISTSYRGIPEMVQDNVNGFLVNPRSPNEIADKLEKLYYSPDIYNKMSIASLQWFQIKFNRNIIGKKLIETILGETNE